MTVHTYNDRLFYNARRSRFIKLELYQQ